MRLLILSISLLLALSCGGRPSTGELVSSVLRDYSKLIDRPMRVDPTVVWTGDPFRPTSEVERAVIHEATELTEMRTGDAEAARACAHFTSSMSVPSILLTNPEPPPGCKENLPPVFALQLEEIQEGLRVIGWGWDEEWSYHFIAEVDTEGDSLQYRERGRVSNRM